MPAPTPVFLGRNDTILGVCEALGQDLGFHANLLRGAFGIGLLFQPMAVIAAYAACGIVVLVSRLLFPVRVIEHRTDVVPAPDLAVVSSAEIRSSEAEPLALAA